MKNLQTTFVHAQGQGRIFEPHLSVCISLLELEFSELTTAGSATKCMLRTTPHH